jgi:hypothetical protein
LAHRFRGYSPWAIGSIAFGPVERHGRRIVKLNTWLPGSKERKGRGNVKGHTPDYLTTLRLTS